MLHLVRFAFTWRFLSFSQPFTIGICREAMKSGVRSRGIVEQRLVGTLMPVQESQLHVTRIHATSAKRWKQIWKQRLITAAVILSDVLLAALIWSVAYVLQGIWGRGPLSEAAIMAIIPSVAAWVGLRAMLGLYPGYGLDWVEQLRRHTYSVFATLSITAIFALAFQFGDLLSRLLLVEGFLGLLLLAPLSQYFTKQYMRKIGAWGKPVVIISSGEAGARVNDLIEERWELGYRPIASFGYRLTLAEESIEDPSLTNTTLSGIAKLAKSQAVDTVIFAMPHTRREHVATLVDWASTRFRHVMVIPNLSGITNSAVVARDLAGTFGVEIKHNLLSPWARRAKRLLDLSGAVLGGLLISPILLAILTLIKIDSPGPAFYGHQRLGARSKHFRCWKFRTMRRDAEKLLDEYLQNNPHLRAEWESNHKLRDDPRVTRIGRFLRKTSLDELPQLWNVLKGEMSLVGPRPIVDGEVSKYGEVYKLYERIRPGMSGFWQVSGRSDTSYAERVRMDSYYVRNWSIWLDLVILARTVKSVVLGRGAH